ncbi:winged helix-turn-helix transcriptional regulator [Curtobacterium sp. VKM Ac-2861]|uniref:MarR family winged helix-turn-helix transcriptional regulator n=1 Tax=Curtobacterium sp. VKM Ac-2861 TaxID=2739016 RepID=UPI0015640881|nr:winged helix-turn-helix transcriptional regulator [Curtobacterium sp. VKM Ac-2861]
MSDTIKITEADIDAVVGWTVIRAARQAGRIVAMALKEHGLTPVEFGVLSQLAAANGELTQAEVARAAEIRAQSVAPIIDGLDGRGLIRREGVRGRGRSGRLFLSEDGAALLNKAFPDVLATNELFVDGDSQTLVNDQLLAFLSRSRQTEQT